MMWKWIIQKYKINANINMDTALIKSENGENFEPHVLMVRLTDESHLRRGEKSIALSNLSIHYTWKNIKI